jgi:hypothetical protein
MLYEIGQAKKKKKKKRGGKAPSYNTRTSKAASGAGR